MPLPSPAASRICLATRMLLSLFFIGSCSVLAQESKPPEVPGHQLVQQLADASFTKRQQAQQELLKLGPLAQQALQRGLGHSDPEVRRSCRRLLADVLEGKYQRELQAFIEDPASKAGQMLPGWKRFQERAGNDPAARSLFVKMQQAERGLLASLEAGNEAAAEALDTRFRQVYSRTYSRVANQRKTPSLGTLAALLFVCGDPQLELPQTITDNNYWVNLLQQPTLQQALGKNPDNRSLRIMLGDWIAKPNSIRSLYNKLRLSLQHEIPAGLQLAMETLQESKNLSGSYQAYCVHVIAMMGGKNYSRSLNDLLTNQTVCSRRILTKNGMKVELTVEIRDVALAWLLFLHEQDHKQYGMLQAKATLDRTRLVTRVPSLSVSTSSLGYSNTSQRPKAMKKWQAFIADHPLPPVPKKLTVVPRPKPKPKSPAAKPGAGPKKPNLEQAIDRLRKAIPAKPADKPADKPAVKKPVKVPLVRIMVPPPGRPLLPPMIFPGIRPQPGQDKDQEPKQVTVPGMPIADREMTRRLSLARRAISENSYAEAVILLGQILTAKSDHTFQPDRNIPLSRGLKAAAEEAVGNMPAAGREAYQLHFGAQAQRLLDEATEQGETALLTRISHQFFHTTAGAEATYLLGTHYLDQNHPLRGAMYFQRLQQKSHYRQKFEPVLDVQMATCWALAGLPQRAEQVLLQLKRKSPDVQLNVRGTRQGLFTQSGQALSWLADQIGPFARLAVRNSWPLFRGNSQRNQLSKGDIAYLDNPEWQVIEQTAYLKKQISTLRTSTLDKRFPLLPSMQPLVVNETVLFRTPTE
ncbi:MAG: hypothetical protein VB877_11700 [Pirellulaceae bacterium]